MLPTMSGAVAVAAATRGEQGHADPRPSPPRWLAVPAVFLLAVALVLGGGRWELPRPGQFEIVVPSANAGAVTIRLDDRTGLVRDIAGRIPATVGTGVVRVAAADPRILVVGWTVGICDGDTRLSLTYGIEGPVMTVQTSRSLTAPGPCGLLPGFGRSVALTLREPIDPATVVLQYQP